MAEKSPAIFLNNNINGFKTKLREGYHRIDTGIYEGPQYSIPLEDLGRSELEWLNDKYNVLAMAQKYLADVSIFNEDKRSFELKRGIIISGGIIIELDKELENEKKKVRECTVGNISKAVEDNEIFRGSRGLSELIFGSSLEEKEMENRIALIVEGYIQQKEQEEEYQRNSRHQAWKDGRWDATPHP